MKLWKKIYYYALILLGGLGIIQSLLVAMLSNFHFGIIIPGVAGILFIVYGIYKIRHQGEYLLKNKFLRYTAWGIFISGVTLFLVLVAGMYMGAQTDEGDKPCHYVIVLGAGIRGETLSYDLTQRVEGAVVYMQAHPESIAILTGGQGAEETITEAEAMRRYMVARGVDEDRIILEEQAKSTYENFLYSVELIKEKGDINDCKVMISTSDYHMFRAKMLSRRAGLDAYGITGRTRFGMSVNAYLRECVAILNSALFQWY